MEEKISIFNNGQLLLEATISNIAIEIGNLKAQMLAYQQNHASCTSESITDNRFTRIMFCELSIGLEEQRTDIPVLTVIKDETGNP